MNKEILIIGGGFAGLSAAVELVDRGHHVTIIEKRGHLGGRAYSYRDPMTGATLDNGQHILMGCYHDTLSFLRKIGTLDKIEFQKNMTVDFAAPGINPLQFRARSLPSPWHLLSGFLLFSGFNLQDKLAVLRMRKLLGKNGFHDLDVKSVSSWLRELRQTDRLCERFWDPLTYAALNDRPEVSSAELFQAVLKEALFSGSKGSRIGIPQVGLSDLYADAARDYIERKGGQFLIKAAVSRLHFQGIECTEVELEGGRRISPEHILVTVPFTALKKILPEEILYRDHFFAPISRLSTSPIVSIHLWYDREIIDKPFIGLWQTKTHWVFQKKGHDRNSTYLSLVISGARDELHQPAPQLIEMATRELASVFPTVSQAKLLRATVSKEPEATMAPAPGASKFRCSQKTPYKNLFLAGDWTDTGLPATIESAVRSAKKAVELIDQGS